LGINRKNTERLWTIELAKVSGGNYVNNKDAECNECIKVELAMNKKQIKSCR